MHITFLGGSETVTGSKLLFEHKGTKVLIDCGLFQGLKALRALNREDFPINPSTIDQVIITHAHLDHCGYLPLLVKNGYNGEIHMTHPTVDMVDLILLDSGKIQEEEAERANRHGYSKHSPAEPLYTLKQAAKVRQQMIGHNYDEWVIINADIKFRLLNSGHVLGSAMVELKVEDKTILFSGDLGRKDPMLLYPVKKLEQCDYLVLESTYGGRIHKEDDPKARLKEIIQETVSNKGILLIPVFAIERAQEIIYLISQLKDEEPGVALPVYLDSPMGADATQIMMDYREWADLSKEAIYKMQNAVKLIRDAQTSRFIVEDDKPRIVLAGSGMLEGGRILHYLNKYISDSKCTLFLVGFQAEGTRGRALLENCDEIKFFGEYKKVGARVLYTNALSGHADQSEIIDWLSNFKTAPKKVFLNHGENQQSQALRVKIETEYGWSCEVSKMGMRYSL